MFKKGNAGLASNYIPLSLTSVPSKILERIILNKIVEHLNVNNIVHPAQRHCPIVFIIIINELVEKLQVHGIQVEFVAADSKMYAKIIDGFDVVRLQATLHPLTE